MDISKLSTLKIIKNNPETMKPKSFQNNPDSGSTGKLKLTEANTSNISDQMDLQNNPNQTSLKVISAIEPKYKDLRKGKINLNDFNRKLLEAHPTLMDTQQDNPSISGIIQRNKKMVNRILLDTLNWYIQLKILISTGLSLEDCKNSENINYKKLASEDLPIIQNQENDPKGFSTNVKKFLENFVYDNGLMVLDQQYKITDEMVSYLYNERPGFINEVVVLFELYSKYYNTLSEYLIEDAFNKSTNEETDPRSTTFRFSISKIQPRFDMINRHIFYTLETKTIKNPEPTINLDLNKIIDPNILPIQNNGMVSKFSLMNRLTNLNNWLINGIVNIGVSINRLNGLKPITQPGKTRDLLDFSERMVVSNYDIWLILKDTKSFLDSLKELIDGSAFITGIPSGDILDILDTNY